MFKKIEKVSRGNPIGKSILAGYLIGKGVECMSNKKTKYSTFFATNLAAVGVGIYFCGKIKKKIERLLKK